MRFTAVTIAFAPLALLANATAAAPASGPDPSVLPGAPIPAGEDAAERMTVPVSIGDHGPYQFVVDTGADRTVISRELATDLKLDAGAPAQLHSMSGVSSVQTVIIPELSAGKGRQTRDVHAPALARANLGAAGMLGVDSLIRRRIVMDFRSKTMSISEPKVEEPRDPDVIVVTGKRRFGQLVLVDATANGQKVYVIIDTGAQVSIGNEALRKRLMQRDKNTAMYDTELISVTGGRTPAMMSVIAHIRIGGVNINNMQVAFADVHPFRKFGLVNQPALLLGMDMLRRFDRVSVDFADRKVRFMMPDGALRELLARAG